MVLKRIFILCVVLSAVSIVIAQKTTIYTHDNLEYNEGLELYDKEKFSAAQEVFEKIIKSTSDNKSEMVVNAS